jgi:hypothetical protein
VNVHAEVVLVRVDRLAGVHPHADAQLGVGRPGIGRDGALRRDRCVSSRGRVLEGDKELVSAHVDFDPVPLGNRRANEVPMLDEHFLEVVRELVRQSRRPLDVREQECDGPRG